MSSEEYEKSYRAYEQKCNEIRMKNEIYLEEFKQGLVNAGLKENTINRHFQNVYFYINTYLMREEPLEMISGTHSFYLDDFFGYFFISKCMWSTPNSIRTNAASVKKFYKSMFQRGYIDKSDYRELLETIKYNMDTWLEDCESYNDPSAPNPFRGQVGDEGTGHLSL